jgi:hypothetical protein
MEKLFLSEGKALGLIDENIPVQVLGLLSLSKKIATRTGNFTDLCA